MRQLVDEAGLADRITIESAGTAGWHEGKGPDPRTAEAARAHGIHMDHTARRFRAADFDRYDLVVAMDGDNVDALTALAPDAEAAAKVRMLRSYDPASEPGATVPDPYYGGDEGFTEVIALCRADHIRRGDADRPG